MSATNGHAVTGSLASIRSGYHASEALEKDKKSSPNQMDKQAIYNGMRLPNMRARIFDYIKSKKEPISAGSIAKALELEGYRSQTVLTAISLMKSELLESYGPAAGTVYPELIHLQDGAERPTGMDYVRKPTVEDSKRESYAVDIAKEALKSVDLKKVNKTPGDVPPTTNNSIRTEIARLSNNLSTEVNNSGNQANSSDQQVMDTTPSKSLEVEIPKQAADLTHHHFKISWRGQEITLSDAIEMQQELSLLTDVLKKVYVL